MLKMYRKIAVVILGLSLYCWGSEAQVIEPPKVKPMERPWPKIHTVSYTHLTLPTIYSV